MKMIQPQQYRLIYPSLKKVRINCLFVRSVLERHVDGSVYCDDTAAPQGFYVVHPYGMSLLFGKISDQLLNNGFIKNILKRRNAVNDSEFLQVFPTEIEKRLDQVFNLQNCPKRSQVNSEISSLRIVKHKRINFTFDRAKLCSSMILKEADRYCIREIDESVFLTTEGSVVPKKFWSSFSSFKDTGKGYALCIDNQIAAVAFSSFIHDGKMELGMETKKPYRRKGLATAACARLIRFCLEEGLEPVWACRADNSSSYGLARKLGFEPSATLPYYQIEAAK